MISLDHLLEKNVVPDFLIRVGIRHLLAQTLRDKISNDLEAQQDCLMQHVRELKSSPIAVQMRAANEQHYEVPTAFYQKMLGKRLKYSSGLWSANVSNLDAAEEAMLALSAQRAELEEGQNVLELGCGWGSLSLWMASTFPKSQILAVSNSRTQKDYIDAQAKMRGLSNLTIQTADMNDFDTDRRFDRVVSVEMFEHMKNYELLLERIASWLNVGGKLFVHIFTHRTLAYHYEDKGPKDWMTRYFFAGGQMPSDDLLLYFQEDLQIEDHWQVSGQHYQKTAEAWLENMDRNRKTILPLFEQTYGSESATKWWAYWRIFLMSCAELWGYRNGQEWLVSHYRFIKQ